jgi:hypothetical protein
MERRATLREGALGGLDLGLFDRAREAETGELVERRSFGGEGRNAAGDGQRKDVSLWPPARRRRRTLAKEADLGALDAGREHGAGEEHGRAIVRRGRRFGEDAAGELAHFADVRRTEEP